VKKIAASGAGRVGEVFIIREREKKKKSLKVHKIVGLHSIAQACCVIGPRHPQSEITARQLPPHSATAC